MTRFILFFASIGSLAFASEYKARTVMVCNFSGIVLIRLCTISSIQQ